MGRLRDYLAWCLLPVAAGVMLFLPEAINSDLMTWGPSDLWGVINWSSLYSANFYSSSVAEMFYDFLPMLIFQLVWGTLIYRRFSTCGVYFFSRCKSRSRWYFSESARLFGKAISYVAIFVLTGVVIDVAMGKFAAAPASVWMLICDIATQAFFLFWTTLLVNLIAIGFQSVFGIAVVAAELACIALFGTMEKCIDLETGEFSPLISQISRFTLNPVSHLVMKWHTSLIFDGTGGVNALGFPFPVEVSAIDMIGLSAAVLLAGTMIVGRTELLENEKE